MASQLVVSFLLPSCLAVKPRKLMDFIGLDIGSSTLKAVQLKKEPHRKPKLYLHASGPAPVHSMTSESEADLKAISTSVREFIDSFPFTTRAVVVALPESQIFTRVISLPRMNEKELKSAMQWEAEQYIPVPLSDVTMDYQVLDGVELKKGDGEIDVLLIAAPQTLINKYLRVLKEAKLETVGLETETLAVARSLVGDKATVPVTMVVNIGAATTDISVVARRSVRFTRSIATGGKALARAVSQSLGFEIEQAEEYKKTYGLEETKLEGKVMKAIKPIFDVVVEEIKRSLAFYNTHKKDGNNVKRLVLCGGTASLPGIMVYLASNLNLEVQLGDPWRSLEIPPKFPRRELEEIGTSFAVAVGLSLKEV